MRVPVADAFHIPVRAGPYGIVRRIRVPHPRPVGLAAGTADNLFRIEMKVRASALLLLLGTSFQFFLHIIKKMPVDDCFVTSSDVVLIQFSYVLFDRLGDEIGSVILLQKGFALVLDVSEDAEDRDVAPPFSSSRSLNVLTFKDGTDNTGRESFQKQSVDHAHNIRFFRIHLHVPVVPEEMGIPDGVVAFRELLPDAPRRVLGNAAALLLGQ